MKRPPRPFRVKGLMTARKRCRNATSWRLDVPKEQVGTIGAICLRPGSIGSRPGPESDSAAFDPNGLGVCNEKMEQSKSSCFRTRPYKSANAELAAAIVC